MIGRGVGVSRATALYAAYGAHPARPLKPSPLRFFVDLGFSQKHHCSDFLWICDSYKKHHGSDFLWIFTKKHHCSDFLWIWDFHKKHHRSDFLWIFTKNISALIFCGFGIFTKNITALIFTKNTTALIFLWIWDFYKKHHRSDFLWIWDFHQHHSDFLRSGVHLGFSPISIFFSNVFSMYFGWKLTYPTFYELFKGFGLLIKVVIEMQTSKTSILMCSYVSFYLFLLLGLRSVF